jgi:molecular chaperone HtpG
MTKASTEKKEFQTEIKQILDLMINSLYSHKEIFLRELISNSSDALDKLRFAEITDTNLNNKEKTIRIETNKENKTLSIIDNGIGMTKDEVLKNLGTIAYSGTKEFIKNAEKLKDRPELIGQFGVGFYSSFMVADKVRVITQKAGQKEATLWESEGKGEFEVGSTTREEGSGTTITLFLKDNKDEEGSQDFTEEWTIRSIVKKYSDFVEYPIVTQVTRDEPEKDKDGKEIKDKFTKVIKDETLNSQKAIWLKPAKDISEKDHEEFYKHLSHDWNPPLDTIHYKAEGTQEFTSLIYIPANVPFDYNQKDSNHGLNLYVRRVFISGKCEELIPQYLRFLKGLVDSSDLPLNVSRELIQKDQHIKLIQKALVSKILRHFKTILTKDREKYCKFWNNFGATLKEGLASDYTNKDKIAEITLFKSTNSTEYTTLSEYIGRMKKEQKDIYFISGESLSQISSSPYLEKLRKKEFEVLLMTDPVDEWVINSLKEYKEKKLISITSDDLDLDTDSEKKDKKEELEKQKSKFEKLCSKIKDSLKDNIKEVRISSRLVDSPACLVNSAQDPSAHMERIMQKIGKQEQKSLRILEINPEHAIFEKMLNFSGEKLNNWSQILYNQALLNEGSPVKDPMSFSKQISNLMISA